MLFHSYGTIVEVHSLYVLVIATNMYDSQLSTVDSDIIMEVLRLHVHCFGTCVELEE